MTDYNRQGICSPSVVISLLFGSALILTVYRIRDPLDRRLSGFFFLLKRRSTGEDAAIPWLRHIIRNVRSGEPLSTALESFAEPLNPYATEGKRILRGADSPDPMIQFIKESVQSGAPVLGPLQFLLGRLEKKVKNQRRIRALTAQARLQAAVVFFAPWGLLLTLCASDPELAAASFQDPLCIFIWTAALLMSTIGFFWIRRILKSALLPKNEEERSALELLPPFLIHIYAHVSSGLTVEEAVRRSCSAEYPTEFKSFFSDVLNPAKSEAHPLLIETHRSLRSCAIFGSPLKEEIERILEDCESRRDAFIEETIQKLPVRILAPLFAFILPAALLILFSFLLPVFNQWT